MFLNTITLLCLNLAVSLSLFVHIVKLGYNEHAWDRLILFVITVIRYNREGLCTKVTIWDRKL